MANWMQLGLRGWEFIWSLLVMALIGNMLAEDRRGNPSSVQYCIFVAAFSMASLFYLIPASISDSFSFHPIISIALDLLNSLFFLTSGIALAARLECHSCNNRSYLHHNDVARGSEKRCREAQASTAFLWFAWACYTASLFLSFLASRSTGVNLRGRTSSRRRPAMTQV